MRLQILIMGSAGRVSVDAPIQRQSTTTLRTTPTMARASMWDAETRQHPTTIHQHISMMAHVSMAGDAYKSCRS